MNYKVIVSLILLTAFASACNKDGVFTGPKIYVMTDYRAAAIYTYTYNSDGTVSVQQANIGPKTTWQYNNSSSPHTVLMNNYSGGGGLSSATMYYLNSAGYADTSQGQYQSSNNTSAYTYDDNNQLVEERDYVLGSLRNVYDYTKINKNITELVTTTINGGTTTIGYDYYTYLSTNSNTIGNQNKGYYYLGVSSSNLVSTDVVINQALDTTDIITYHYYFDGSSRVDTMAYYHRDGVRIDSLAFTYY